MHEECFGRVRGDPHQHLRADFISKAPRKYCGAVSFDERRRVDGRLVERLARRSVDRLLAVRDEQHDLGRARAATGEELPRGLEAAGQLFANDSRVGATKIVLLVSDGEQTVDAAPGKTFSQTAVDAAASVKGLGATVFAWGFGGKVSSTTVQQIATDSSKAIVARDLAELTNYLGWLKVAVYMKHY